MKILALIFCFYISVLSCIPCEENNFTSNEKTSQTEQHQNHSHNNESCDVCSPFCTCACCQSSFFMQAQIQIQVAEQTRIFSSPQISSTVDISIPVWQPPQLS